jgi:predicted component of type VI protein secretion system
MTVNIRELEKILEAKIQLMDLPNPVAATVVANRLVPVILDIVRRELRTELNRRDRIKEA